MINDESLGQFDFCDKVDLHALDSSTPLENVVYVAAEHGFRGIVVTLCKIEELVKLINKPLIGDKKIIPICAIDYPYGNMSHDVRSYCMHAAKEKGAKEIEIVAPYHFIENKDFKNIFEDAKNIVNLAKKLDLKIKYVLDQNNPKLDDGVKTRIYRILSQCGIEIISTSLGFFDKKDDHSNSILKMRSIKSKINCKIKTFLSTDDAESFALYPKAGADIIGVYWKQAPQLIHAYEDIVEKKV